MTRYSFIEKKKTGIQAATIHDSRLPNNDSRITNHENPAFEALLLILFLNLALQPLVEPDFGWHLRTGLDLLQHHWQMPMTDPYSHTMPDWPWVEHAWLSDGLLALLFTTFGTAGPLAVIVLFAAVIVGAFWLASATAHAPRTARLTAIVIAGWIALPFLGARIQMVTLLGLSVLLVLRQRIERGRRDVLWIIPGLFLLWANLHGGFTAGLFVLLLILAVSVAVRVLVDRRPMLAPSLDAPVLSWPDLGRVAIVLVLSCAVTLMNPYGWRLYSEIVQSLGDRLMLDTLREWQPVSIQDRAGRLVAAYIAGLVVTGAFFYRRIEPVRWVVLLTFLALALRHWRNVPLFLIVSVPFAAEMLAAVFATTVKKLPGVRRHAAAWWLAATVAGAGLLVGLGSDHLQRIVLCGTNPSRYFTQTEYPIEAVAWIKAHRADLGTRLYNDYGMGGFLLWWLPDEKIFIDGRMPAWRIGDRWILYDYLALVHRDPPALKVLDKYGVDWAMTQRSGALDAALRQQMEWRQVYEDAKTVIFVRG